jgi:hypothetical protein
VPLPAISAAVSRVPLPAISVAMSRMPSPAISAAVSRVLSVASSRAPLTVPSPGPSSYPPSLRGRSPVRLDEGGSGSDGDGDIVDSDREEDCGGNISEMEENDMDEFMDASRSEPKVKVDIRSWEELREQLKSDLREGHKKHEAPTCLNKLTIIQNFATLRIKGVKHMATSKEIAWQFHEGVGGHFAHQIRVLARHYQLFEQLPEERRGGAGGRSLLKDERVQAAARTYLLGVPTGEVTPRKFHHALTKQILPMLGFTVKDGLLERTVRRWLLTLGWRCTRVKKGVYMDGHERPDIVEYRNNVFLLLMVSFERRMAQWKPEGPGLVRIEPDLGPGEKRIIAVFQDESCFHANDNKQNAWCAPAADLHVALFPLTLKKEPRWKAEVDEERKGETHSYSRFRRGRQRMSYRPQSRRRRGERRTLHYVSGRGRRPMVGSCAAPHASQLGDRHL